MSRPSKDFSIIDKGLTVEGALRFTGKLVIKGTVKGTLDGDTVVVASEGAVYAKTKVVDMTVAGIFKGDIHASVSLCVLATGNCSGTVVCKNLIVEAKGILNAEVSSLATENSNPDKTASLPLEPK